MAGEISMVWQIPRPLPPRAQFVPAAIPDTWAARALPPPPALRQGNRRTCDPARRTAAAGAVAPGNTRRCQFYARREIAAVHLDVAHESCIGERRVGNPGA